MNKNFMFPYLSFLACLILWIIWGIAWFTPNNVLHQKGFGNLVGFDFFVSSLIGLILAVVSISKRNNYSSHILFWSNQVLSWGLLAVPVIVLIITFVGVIF